MALTEEELLAVQDLNARIECASEACANQAAGKELTADIDDAGVVTVSSPDGPIFCCSLEVFKKLRGAHGSGISY